MRRIGPISKPLITIFTNIYISDPLCEKQPYSPLE